MSPNTSAVFIPGLSYVVPHPAPPGSVHFPEKTPGLASTTSHLTPSAHGHFEEHLKNIRQFHQDLQNKLKTHLHHDVPTDQTRASDRREQVESEPINAMLAPESNISSVTSSFLVQNLR